jgi:hypothetical protein
VDGASQACPAIPWPHPPRISQPVGGLKLKPQPQRTRDASHRLHTHRQSKMRRGQQHGKQLLGGAAVQPLCRGRVVTIFSNFTFVFIAVGAGAGSQGQRFRRRRARGPDQSRRRPWGSRGRRSHRRSPRRGGGTSTQTIHPALDCRVGPATGECSCSKLVGADTGGGRRCRRGRRRELGGTRAGEHRGASCTRSRRAGAHLSRRGRRTHGDGERAHGAEPGSGRSCSNGGRREEIWAAALTRCGRARERNPPFTLAVHYCLAIFV